MHSQYGSAFIYGRSTGGKPKVVGKEFSYIAEEVLIARGAEKGDMKKSNEYSSLCFSVVLAKKACKTTLIALDKNPKI